jgi:hypothetical protein
MAFHRSNRNSNSTAPKNSFALHFDKINQHTGEHASSSGTVCDALHSCCFNRVIQWQEGHVMNYAGGVTVKYLSWTNADQQIGTTESVKL